MWFLSVSLTCFQLFQPFSFTWHDFFSFVFICLLILVLSNSTFLLIIRIKFWSLDKGKDNIRGMRKLIRRCIVRVCSHWPTPMDVWDGVIQSHSPILRPYPLYTLVDRESVFTTTIRNCNRNCVDNCDYFVLKNRKISKIDSVTIFAIEIAILITP